MNIYDLLLDQKEAKLMKMASDSLIHAADVEYLINESNKPNEFPGREFIVVNIKTKQGYEFEVSGGNMAGFNTTLCCEALRLIKEQADTFAANINACFAEPIVIVKEWREACIEQAKHIMSEHP